MIDPCNVTDHARTPAQLEEFLLFCVVVAGKNADQQARKLEGFLKGRRPFALIRELERKGTLEQELKRVRIGKYSLLVRGFRQLAASGIDLASCSWEDLTQFPGIGLKTAKFFVLHSREGEMHGVLDTHVLGWISEHWAPPGSRQVAVPRHSPQDPSSYRFWETVYFGMVTARFHHSARPGSVDWAKFDLDLWMERRGSAAPA
jgi:hypothetical protein